MDRCKICLAFITCMAIFSCNRYTTVAYYNDNTQVDDGEIFGDHLASFFKPDNYIYIKRVDSKTLHIELGKIADSLRVVLQDEELDDSYYGYAFITSKKDTLFSDYSLSYWKNSNNRRKALRSEKLKEIVRPVFVNPYLKK